MNTTHYWETGSTDPAWNLAFEEYLLHNRKTGDHLILWQNDNTVVVGNNQITEAEINRDYIDAHGVHVVRRTSGGGAVYHDMGNLNYSFLTDYDPSDQLDMGRFLQPIAEMLCSLGVSAEVSGRNDILVEGHKVSGTAQKIVGGRILHHGTLLFDSDLEAVAGALQVHPEKLIGKGTRSVRSRVGNIRQLLPHDMELSEFRQCIKAALLPVGTETGSLTAQELQGVLQLKAEKYDSWAWNYGRSPKAQLHAEKRFPGGTLSVYADLEAGRIAQIAFYGDFLSRRPISELTEKMVGLPFSADEIRQALLGKPFADYFGTISLSELLELLFSDDCD